MKILFEDEDLLVVDKPSGMIVNRSDTASKEKTVQDLVERKIEVDSDHDSEFEKRGGIVHRLDRETSGILIVAKKKSAFENLQAQFKERKVKKEYIALVHGQVKPEVGEINVPVGRLPWNRERFGVLSGGRNAVTRYHVISPASPSEAGRANSPEDLSLLQVYPETGRTHQIRVHLKYIGHPIFSDPLYGGRKTSRNDRKILDRTFLHAQSISFDHPKSGKRVSLKSPMPKELQETLKMLKFKYTGGDLDG